MNTYPAFLQSINFSSVFAFGRAIAQRRPERESFGYFRLYRLEEHRGNRKTASNDPGPNFGMSPHSQKENLVRGVGSLKESPSIVGWHARGKAGSRIG